MNVPARAAQPVRRPRRGGQGALFLVALLLGGSGVIRLGLGTDLALAKTQEAALEAGAAEASSCEPDGGALAMLDELRAREERLRQREAEVADREQALAVAKSEIDGRLAELVSAEEKLSATLTLADEAADEDVARLVTVYEKMKPKDAASLFAEMDPDFAAGFVARMRPDAAAAVMAGLDPKEAYTISVVLAGRNANAPQE